MLGDTTLVSDAWQQGFEAYNRDPCESNPYDEADAQHDQWVDGWRVAKYEQDENDDTD